MAPPPFVFHPDYVIANPRPARFPVSKSGAIARRLVDDGLLKWSDFHAPTLAPRSWLERAHAPDYVDAVLSGRLSADAERRIGVRMTDEVVRRARLSCGGAVLAARLALARGLACNTAGGSHHAARDHGAGYCIFNDVAVALHVLLEEGEIRRALVIDLDVHQGDGTALIFCETKNVFTFSMHCAQNFPSRKQTSDCDVALPAGVGDSVYFSELERSLPAILERAAPDLAFFIAGVDVHEDDRLGKLNITDAGLVRREAYVLRECRRRGVPVAGVMGGGYGDDVEALAFRHTRVHHACAAQLKAEAGRGVPHAVAAL